MGYKRSNQIYSYTWKSSSLWNKNKQVYELDCLHNISLIFDTCVYRCLTKMDVYHNQIFVCGNTGQHIIIPFNQNILKQNPNQTFNSYVNFSVIPNSHFLVELVENLQDENEIHINFSKITGLIFNRGTISINQLI